MQRVWRTHCNLREANMIGELYSLGWEVIYMKKPSNDGKIGRLILTKYDEIDPITILYKKIDDNKFKFSMETTAGALDWIDSQPPSEITEVIKKHLST